MAATPPKALRLVGKICGVIILLVAIALAGLRIAAVFREDQGRLPSDSTILATPLGRIAVQASGPPGGHPVVLVGGTAGWSGFWRDVRHDLAARGYRVVAVDLPPFGFSESDPRRRYDRVQQAERILAAVQAAAPQRPVTLVGHSYGAGPALEAALRSPNMFRRLVLVDAALGPLDAPASEAPRLLRTPLIAETLVAAGFTNPWAVRPMLRSMLARKDAADTWIEALREPMRRDGTTEACAAWLPALFDTADGALSRSRSNIARLRVPVSIIWGEADTVTPIKQGEELARLVRAQDFHRLPATGHIPHIEEPARFLQALSTSIGKSK